MNHTCPFCYPEHARASLIHSYGYWNLFLQSAEKRRETKQAAGFLALQRHAPCPTDALPEEWTELKTVIKDASRRLCEVVGVMYMGQETIGFNQGVEAGQTIDHAHVHVLPVAEEDPVELKVRGGIGGAFEALRRERLNE